LYERYKPDFLLYGYNLDEFLPLAASSQWHAFFQIKASLFFGGHSFNEAPQIHQFLAFSSVTLLTTHHLPFEKSHPLPNVIEESSLNSYNKNSIILACLVY
jgi:hypothetical protein